MPANQNSRPRNTPGFTRITTVFRHESPDVNIIIKIHDRSDEYETNNRGSEGRSPERTGGGFETWPHAGSGLTSGSLSSHHSSGRNTTHGASSHHHHHRLSIPQSSSHSSSGHPSSSHHSSRSSGSPSTPPSSGYHYSSNTPSSSHRSSSRHSSSRHCSTPNTAPSHHSTSSYSSTTTPSHYTSSRTIQPPDNAPTIRSSLYTPSTSCAGPLPTVSGRTALLYNKLPRVDSSGEFMSTISNTSSRPRGPVLPEKDHPSTSTRSKVEEWFRRT